MTAKAVYAQQCLNLYITREEIDSLLNDGSILVPLYIGKTPAGEGTCLVIVDEDAWKLVAGQILREREAIESTRKAAGDSLVRYPRKWPGKKGGSHGEGRG